MNLDKMLFVMETAAMSAGRIVHEMQRHSTRLESRKDFLTDADLRAEEVILDTLASEYHEIPSFSEEKGGREIRDGLVWVVDPIDGTINFFLQDDHWGVSIALVENGHTIAGVICLPAKKQLFSASRDTAARLCHVDGDEMAWTNISVNDENYLAESQFWVAWCKKKEHGGYDHKEIHDVIIKLDQHTFYPQIRNSATADMMMVACGKIAGYVFLKPQPFDIAAAGFIIERAGGRVTDIDGNPWNPFSSSIVASNNILHHDLLRVINA